MPTSSRCSPSTAPAAPKAISISASRRRCGPSWSPPIFSSAWSRIRPNAKPGTVYRISDLELASRLSFFLWSSVPDDTLLDLAEKNKLRDPAILNAQLRRMLDDPRADSLVSNFAGQWLYTRSLSQQKPDPDAFPEFDESLRTVLPARNRAVLPGHPARRPSADRTAGRQLHVPQSAPRRTLRDPQHLRPAVPQGDSRRRQSRRPAGAGKPAHRHQLPESHLGGAARQMDSGEPAGLAAAAAAAGSRPGDARQGRPQAHDARSDGDAPLQRRLPELPRAHGPDRVRAGELRRRRQVARQG